jgi:hypothetical protein
MLSTSWSSQAASSRRKLSSCLARPCATSGVCTPPVRRCSLDSGMYAPVLYARCTCGPPSVHGCGRDHGSQLFNVVSLAANSCRAVRLMLQRLDPDEVQLVDFWSRSFRQESEDFSRLLQAEFAAQDSITKLRASTDIEPVPNLGKAKLPKDAPSDPNKRKAMRRALLSAPQLRSLEAADEHSANCRSRLCAALVIRWQRAKLERQWRSDVRSQRATSCLSVGVRACCCACAASQLCLAALTCLLC